MKYSLSFILALFTFLTIASCQGQTNKASGGVDLLPPATFMQAYQAEDAALLIDCRTPGEIARGKVKGAIDIDFRSPDFANQVEKLDKNLPVYIYCQSGGRSAAAAKKLKTIGFEQVHDMEGGFGAYRQE